MIILNTNIILELMKAEPDRKVINWINECNPLELYLSSITIAEIYYGISVLPDGVRKNKLQFYFENSIQNSFKQRILSFNQESAILYGVLMVHRKTLGKPMSVPDGQIASISKTHQAFLATRNVKDFEDIDLKIINPFE